MKNYLVKKLLPNAFKQHLKSRFLENSSVRYEFFRTNSTLPTRKQQLKSLQDKEFDVLVIGGGATGAGCALDATTRGLKTALVEMDDFASGTSSKSTKLIHGGVRYLQAALMKFDIEQFKMVIEALRERNHMLKSAAHLTRQLPILLPVHKWWQLPYFWMGMKMYDMLAFSSSSVKSSYVLLKKKTLELYPLLKSDKLSGSIVYYDGQMDDSRMNLTIAITAARKGATIANHLKVLKLIKNNDIISGVLVRDELTNNEWSIKAKCVINATGVMIDLIRKLDDSNATNICVGALGSHIVLPKYYSPPNMGLLDPATSDDRVIFFLPWYDHVIAGTTDLPTDITHHPHPTHKEVKFILNEIKHYLGDNIKVRQGDILSVWSGIRPLVNDPTKTSTKALVRNHIVIVSKSKLITIAGGKWTTYRSMAEHTINKAIEVCNLQPKHKKCQTLGLHLDGAEYWTPQMYINLVQDYGLPCDIAQNMSYQYGTRAFDMIKLTSHATDPCLACIQRLHPDYPFTVADVRYGVYEYGCTAIDMIARRLRLALLNREVAKIILKDVISIMSKGLRWDKLEEQKQHKDALNFLDNEMNVPNTVSQTNSLPDDKILLYTEKFKNADKNNMGFVTTVDILRHLKEMDRELSPSDFREILNEVDVQVNGQINLQEYLLIMELAHNSRTHNLPNGIITDTEIDRQLKKRIPVERSGGSV